MSGPCGDCGRRPLETVSGAAKPGDPFVEMAPGRDGKPWWLCLRCWWEGLTLKTREQKPPQMVSGEFAGALVRSGCKATENGDGTVTISKPR